MKESRVQCPSCGQTSPWTNDNRWRPFCSERCKMVDLASWMDESRRIPGAFDRDAAERILLESADPQEDSDT